MGGRVDGARLAGPLAEALVPRGAYFICVARRRPRHAVLPEVIVVRLRVAKVAAPKSRLVGDVLAVGAGAPSGLPIVRRPHVRCLRSGFDRGLERVLVLAEPDKGRDSRGRDEPRELLVLLRLDARERGIHSASGRTTLMGGRAGKFHALCTPASGPARRAVDGLWLAAIEAGVHERHAGCDVDAHA